MSAATPPPDRNLSAKSSLWKAGACWLSTSRHKSANVEENRFFRAKQRKKFVGWYTGRVRPKPCRWMSLHWLEGTTIPRRATSTQSHTYENNTKCTIDRIGSRGAFTRL